MLRRRYLLGLVVIVFHAAVSLGQTSDWAGFRGGGRQGISDASNVPTHWAADLNIRWKVPLPMPANGSPIVVGNKVFVTSAQDADGHQRSLYCFDLHTGTQNWVRTATIGETLPKHKTNPYCGSTPVATSNRVVVWHGSAGLYCYDHEGTEIWSRQLGTFRHMWGYGSSPIVVDDTVVMYCGPGESIFLVSFDLETGEERWRVDEPQVGDGEKNEKGNYMGSWATPVLTTFNGQRQLIVAWPTRLAAYDAASGTELWTCDGLRGERGDLAYSSPMIEQDLCVMIGGFKGPSLAVRLGGSGNVTDTHRVWLRDSNPQSIGTGVLVGSHLYRANAGPGTIDCVDIATGETLWENRAEGEEHWASVVMVEGNLWATNQAGTTIVFKPDPSGYQAVVVNVLGEATNATPAIVDGHVIIRGANHLYCIAAAE